MSHNQCIYYNQSNPHQLQSKLAFCDRSCSGVVALICNTDPRLLLQCSVKKISEEELTKVLMEILRKLHANG